jgi:hypothetical protein
MVQTIKETIMERKFENALELTLQEMLVVDDNMCCAVYWDDMCKDNAIVMFMEYGGYKTMHAVMKDLHKRLSNRMGHPVSVCHNNPTDESVLIHGGAIDASVYYSDACCKQSGISCCLEYLEKREGYSDEYQTIALGAEAYASMCEKPVIEILNRINWDADPQAQIIRLLVDAYNFTNC